MHRRARHLNPGSAGATLALDSRFISGLSDGDPVSTWSDRSASANNATQTGTARPTFETAEQGGQPVIRFVKISLQYMRTSGGPFGATNGVFILAVASRKSTTDFSVVINHGDFANISETSTELIFASGVRRFMASSFSGASSSSIITNSTTMANGEFAISTMQAQASAATTIRVNGSNTQTSANALSGSINNISGPYGIGGRGTGTVSSLDAHDGDIGLVSVFSGVIMQQPLRRRLEHAAAFSFKIPCS